MTESKIVPPFEEQSKETIASTFLMLLLVADLAFIFLHILLKVTPIVDNPLSSLESDQGYPEFYQYTKYLWIIVLLLPIWLRTRSVGYLVWIVVFAYLLCDDAAQIHETFGVYIANKLSFVPFLGLRAQDYGELAVSAMSGLFLLILLAWSYVRGSDAFKQSTKHLLMLLFIVVFFGIFVDMVHVLLWETVRGLLVVEDGGEMLAVSLVVWYVFQLNARKGNPVSSLRSLVDDALPHRLTRILDGSGKPGRFAFPFGRILPRLWKLHNPLKNSQKLVGPNGPSVQDP